MTRSLAGRVAQTPELLGVLVVAVSANASLHDNGDGTITQTRTDGSQLMWLQDASHAGSTGYFAYGSDAAGTGMSWDDSVTWASNLVFNDHADWRLPLATELDGTGPFLGFGSGGTSEMGGLAGEGIGFPTPAPFANMVQVEFWTGHSLGEDDAVSYGFGYGNVPRRKTIVLGPDIEAPRRLGAWAVRAVVPGPRIAATAPIGNTVSLTLTNLIVGVTTTVEQATTLQPSDWTNTTVFISQGESTNVIEAATNSVRFFRFSQH